jgi:tetratricopeptide (TPR) repeat protein
MAFGFGFNKQKVLSAAEKFVQQGKLQNAIAEYEKIRKHDDKDLTIANTIGDLYSRLGDTANAIECFKIVGDAYAAQGFTVKGIAMYKKIAKLQPSVDGTLKLAELYTQQGLFNDARAQYLQVAEDFMKNGDLDQAIRLFQKVLEMDPENVPMRIKLAEVYIRRGKKKEAWEIFSAAAEALRARGSLAAAEDILQRMLALEPGNSYVLLLRGRSALESGDAQKAIEYLEKASDIDTHPEGLRDLLKAYLEADELAKASPLAEKLLTVHNDVEGLFLLAEASARFGHPAEALEIYSQHADRMLATDSAKLLANLHSIITQVRNNTGALEKVMELLKKAGESTHVNEVIELLAHASVKSGNLERARELYDTLAKSEPQNSLHMQNYQQVADRMAGLSPASGVSAAITAEEGGLIVEELEATAPVVDQSYPDDVAIAVRSAVTEADLFLSYNLPEKALAPLLAVLPQAPGDVRLNQRLAALHTRSKRFGEAAVCCRTLETAYHDAGHPDEAVRYGELAARYERSGGQSAGQETGQITGRSAEHGMAAAAGATEVSTVPWPTASAHDAPAFEVSSAPEFSVHEMDVHADSAAEDLSSEWEQTLSVDAGDGHATDESAVRNKERDEDNISASIGGGTIGSETEDDPGSNPEIAETVDEIHFYLEHFMVDQARAAFEKLQTMTHSAAFLAPLRAALEKGAQPPDEPEVEIAEIEAADVENFEIDVEAPDTPELVASADQTSHIEQLHHAGDHADSDHEAVNHEAEAEPEQFAVAHSGEAEPAPIHAEAFTIEPEHSPETIHAETSAPEPAHYAEPIQAEAHSAPDELTSLVADLESSIGDAFPAAPAFGEAQSASAASLGTQLSTEPSSGPAEKFSGWPGAHAPQPAPALSKSEHEVAAPPAAAPATSHSRGTVRPLATETTAGQSLDGVDLSEMFSELRHELEEEAVAGDDDPETHYNMGVAFREMGLIDEAIGELQKVCAAIDRGHAFSQSIQSYTWLAQCFLDKGVPDAAIHWYEKALNIPGLDNESRLALHYELGSACEQAHNKPQALQHFTYVFGANIDYRDVAERIQALSS